MALGIGYNAWNGTEAVPYRCRCFRMLRADGFRPAGAALGAKAGAAAGFTRFFVILATTHLLLDAAALHQFAKATNCLLDRLSIPDIQLNHKSSFLRANETGICCLPRGRLSAQRESGSLNTSGRLCLSESEKSSHDLYRSRGLDDNALSPCRKPDSGWSGWLKSHTIDRYETRRAPRRPPAASPRNEDRNMARSQVRQRQTSGGGNGAHEASAELAESPADVDGEAAVANGHQDGPSADSETGEVAEQERPVAEASTSSARHLPSKRSRSSMSIPTRRPSGSNRSATCSKAKVPSE